MKCSCLERNFWILFQTDSKNMDVHNSTSVHPPPPIPSPHPIKFCLSVDLLIVYNKMSISSEIPMRHLLYILEKRGENIIKLHSLVVSKSHFCISVYFHQRPKKAHIGFELATLDWRRCALLTAPHRTMVVRAALKRKSRIVVDNHSVGFSCNISLVLNKA